MFRQKVLQILAILFLASFAVSTGRQVVKLSQAKARLDKAEQKLDNLKLENQKLKGELQFRETPEFVEKAAREKLGLAKEGETVVILPKIEDQKVEQNAKGSNLKNWLQRLFGKS